MRGLSYAPSRCREFFKDSDEHREEEGKTPGDYSLRSAKLSNGDRSLGMADA